VALACACATGAERRQDPTVTAPVAGAPAVVPPAQPVSTPASTDPVASRAAAALDPPPAPGSAEAQSDLAVVLWLQRTRTREDVARARWHMAVDLATFAPALGSGFDPLKHPRTQRLVHRFIERGYPALNQAKDRWARPRPFVADARVTPAVEREQGFSYPSGHATRGMLAARVLAVLAPERRAELLEVGLQVGFDRVVGGAHYPSDVLAGQRLGDLLADALLADPELAAEVEAVRAAEWSATAAR
jgi:acid phosphatase (class A)